MLVGYAREDTRTLPEQHRLSAGRDYAMFDPGAGSRFADNQERQRAGRRCAHHRGVRWRPNPVDTISVVSSQARADHPGWRLAWS